MSSILDNLSGKAFAETQLAREPVHELFGQKHQQWNNEADSQDTARVPNVWLDDIGGNLLQISNQLRYGDNSQHTLVEWYGMFNHPHLQADLNGRLSGNRHLTKKQLERVVTSGSDTVTELALQQHGINATPAILSSTELVNLMDYVRQKVAELIRAVSTRRFIESCGDGGC